MIDRRLIVVQSAYERKSDSITFEFLAPYDRDTLSMTLMVDGHDYKVPASRQITIKRPIRNFSFSIAPQRYHPHAVDGSYYGILYYSSLEFPVKQEANVISINIPALDNHFFEMYNINGDVISIINDSFYWKGVKYTKVGDL